MNPADLAIVAVTFAGTVNTLAILLGLRIVARQLRIAAPPKEAQGGPAQPPAGSAGAQ